MTNQGDRVAITEGAQSETRSPLRGQSATHIALNDGGNVLRLGMVSSGTRRAFHGHEQISPEQLSEMT